MKNHTKYKDLPNCLKCEHCEMKFTPDRVVSGHYGYYYGISCTNKDVKSYNGDDILICNDFWYNPNTQDVWCDAGDRDQNDCGFFATLDSPLPCDSEED